MMRPGVRLLKGGPSPAAGGRGSLFCFGGGGLWFLVVCSPTLKMSDEFVSKLMFFRSA